MGSDITLVEPIGNNCATIVAYGVDAALALL